MTPRLQLALVGGVATLLAALSMLPVLTGDRWFALSAAAVAVVVALGEALRRARLDAVSVCCLQVLGLLHLGGLATVGAAGTLYGLPTPTWFGLVGQAVGQAVRDLQSFGPPVPASPGLVLMVVVGVGLTAVAVDTMVARGHVPLTGVPLATLHLIPAVGTPAGVSWPGFVVTTAGYLALLVADRRQQVQRWGRAVAQAGRSGTGLAGLRALDRGGRRLGAAAVAVAVALPVVVPQILLGWLGGGDGSGGGNTIRTRNPIVDLRRDLVRPDNVELFSYVSDGRQAEYLRVVTLDVFDGAQWETGDRRIPRDQQASDGLPEPPGRNDVPEELISSQTYKVEVSDRYESRWLPLPYAARVVDIDGDWRYDITSLDVIGLDTDTRGAQYRVVSDVLAPTDELLRAAEEAPAGFDQLVSLPVELLPDLRPTVEEVTAGAESRYDAAVALQDWFRESGGFVYDLSVTAGNSSSALRDFLFDRTGYCEQFAATMALMARVLGIPSRVAVGFLPGTRAESGVTTVRAHDSHAWPELFFAGVGWVRFEPTPATQTGAAPPWTVAGGTTPADGADEGAGATESATASADPRIPEGLDDALARGGPVTLASRIPWPWIFGVAAVLLLLALPSLTAMALRRRRWRVAGDAPAQAEAAWADVRDAAADVGLRWAAAQTPRTAARRTADQVRLSPEDRDRLDRLVTATERARFAPPPSSAAGEEARERALRSDAAQVRKAVLASAPRRQRWRARLWPAATRALVGPRKRVDERVDEQVDVEP